MPRNTHLRSGFLLMVLAGSAAALEVEIRPAWKVGDRVDLLITKVRGKLARPNSPTHRSFLCKLEVLEHSEAGSVLRAAIEPDPVMLQGLLPEAREAVRQLAPAFVLELEFDSDYDVVGLLNEEKVRAHFERMTREALRLMREGPDRPSDEALAKTESTLLAQTGTSSGLLALAMADLGMYFHPYGWTLSSERPIEVEEELYHLMGAGFPPCRTSYRLLSQTNENDVAHIELTRRLDQGDAISWADKLLSQLDGKPATQPVKKLDMEERAVYDYSRSRGWITKGEWVRTVAVDDSTRRDTLRWEIVPPGRGAAQSRPATRMPPPPVPQSAKMKAALFLADGRGFFVGLGIMAVAFGLATRMRRPRLLGGLLMFGALVVVLSSTPMPWWTWLPLTAVIVAWLGTQRRLRERPYSRLALLLAGISACVVAAAAEIPRRTMPRVTQPLAGCVYVIGDSLAAGMGAGEHTWPRTLKAIGLDIVDLSRAGATVETAMDQAAQIPPGPAVVILEIGGNDLLGGTSSRAYRAGLQRLIERVHADDRQLLMFELPLPPFKHGYGFAQRRLAEQFGVQLIPKRVLSKVVGDDDGTLDGLHLSNWGHSSIVFEVHPMLAPE